jgi:hypothetical protein
MSEPLPYAGPPSRYGPRISRLALLALGLALLQVPIFFMGWRYTQTQDSLFSTFVFLGAFFIPPVATSVVAIISMSRIAASGRRLRGFWISLLASIVAPAWPLGVILYSFVRNFP